MAWTAPRTWVAGEVVTASLLNTHLRDDMNYGRGYGSASRTSGNITLNTTAWANTSTALDITIAAAASDRIRYIPQMVMSTNLGSDNSLFDARCVASGNGFGRSTSNNDVGMPGWYGHNVAIMAVSGAAIRTLVSGDVSGGNVILRLRHRTRTAANRTLNATTSVPLYLFAENAGPAV